MNDQSSQPVPEHRAAIRLPEEGQVEGLPTEREACFEALINGISDLVFLKDCEGRYLVVNPAAANAWGKITEEIIGKDASAIFPPEVAERIAQRDREVLASGTQAVFEEELRIDGELRQLHTILNICRDAQGKILGLAGISREITERKILERILRQREYELTEAHRIARLGTWNWDRATGKVAWSEEVYRTFGCDPTLPAPGYEELQRFHTPKSWTRLEAAVSRAVYQGEPYELDVELTLADGSRRWITSRGEVESYVNGEAAKLRGTIQEITDRKLKENQLANSESRYRSLVRAISDIVWTITPEGGQGSEVPEWQAFTGQTREQAAGFGWANAIHPVEREQAVRAWQEAIAAGRTFEVKYRLRRADGVYRNVLVRAVPVRDASGNILEWIAMQADITRQSAAEEELRLSDERFRRLFESNFIGFVLSNKAGLILDGNDYFLSMVGYSREDLEAGRVRWSEMTPLEFLPLDAAGIAEAAIHSSCTPYEKEYIRKDGSRVPIFIGYTLLEGSQDEYVAFILDLSRQKQVEKSLREREQRFSALAESLPQLIWETNATGENTYVNQRFLEYAGISAQAAIGTSWQNVIHPEDLSQSIEKWNQSLQTGEPFLNEYRLRRNDGVYRYFLARAVPMRNESGEIERWLGSSTDIHDQKLAEQALRRTEKLAVMGRLAASIAHEINNPLTSVTNTLYLALQDQRLSQQTREYLETADQELTRVVQVATQTLRFHKQSTAPVLVGLGDIMDSVFSLFAPRLRTSSLSVEREYRTTEKLYCFGDEIRQVFANLIGNAIDASPEGGVLRVRITSCRSASEGGESGIRVIVADTGAGIPPALQKRVFEPFVSTKEATGTGLGLWVAEEIVRKHRGRISFRSKADGPRRGTVFGLFFPFSGIPQRDQFAGRSD